MPRTLGGAVVVTAAAEVVVEVVDVARGAVVDVVDVVEVVVDVLEVVEVLEVVDVEEVVDVLEVVEVDVLDVGPGSTCAEAGAAVPTVNASAAPTNSSPLTARRRDAIPCPTIARPPSLEPHLR